MRKVTTINQQWGFSKYASEIPECFPKDWETVNLPHTWNGVDGQDGGNDYYRGKCYYAKEIEIEASAENRSYYLQFDGVNSSAEVYWNGEKITTHHGGYSAFRVKLQNIKTKNLLVVTADNSPNNYVYPQNADFTFYGGIYRDVKIISVPKNHFDLEFYGAQGIKVTPVMKGNDAQVSVETYLSLEDACEVAISILDANGKEVHKKTAYPEKTVNLKEQESQTSDYCAAAEFDISDAHLWDGVQNPYLYSAKAQLLKNGEVQDEIQVRFGCRSFTFDAEKGFVLNGRPYPLRGVSRHQDRPEIGNALLPEHHREDMDLILEMGANTIRLAHYQHAQEFYDLCDENGLILWAEIPYITGHLPNGQENTISQMKELIYQNYNHPSIVTWGLSNEITAVNGPKDKSMLENHRVLNELVHSLDKTRKTTLAVITMCGKEEEVVHMTDIVSYNHYFGWYGGSVDMYGKWFDDFHKKYPNRVIGISEYGCEALNWHTSDPKQGDYTEEYQAYYHEEMIKTIMKRPYLWATHVWNMFDFAADARAEGGKNGMNHKGLVTFDRKYKKDSFYAYKAWLSKEPVVHICGKRYVNRVEAVTKVTVYTNQPEVELFANGVSVGKQNKGEYPFFYFQVENKGETILTAKAGNFTDESKICKVEQFDESYRLKEEGAILNWFEITAPEGCFSINDTIGDIMGTFCGKIFVLKMAKRILGGKKKSSSKKEKTSDGGFKFNGSILEMAKGFTVKRVLSMASVVGGEEMTKEEMLAVNEQLNRIRKKKH